MIWMGVVLMLSGTTEERRICCDEMSRMCKLRRPVSLITRSRLLFGWR